MRAFGFMALAATLGCHAVGDVTGWTFTDTTTGSGSGGSAAQGGVGGGGGSSTAAGGSGVGPGGAPPVEEWWDTSYAKRRPIVVTADDDGPVPNGATLMVSVDTAAFIAAGDMQANGNDLRLARWTGDTWIELDRWIDDGEGDGIDGADTRVWFPVRLEVAPDATDAWTYVYYGNLGAGAAPADMNEVFLFGDDFESDFTNLWALNLRGEAVATQMTTVRAGSAAIEIAAGSQSVGGIHHDIDLPSQKLIFSHYLRQNASGASFGHFRAVDTAFASRTLGWSNEDAIRGFAELNSGDNLEFVTSNGALTWNQPFGNGVWHHIDIEYDVPLNTTRGRLDFGTWSAPYPDRSETGAPIRSIALEGEGQGGTFQIDNYTIRLAVDPEPVVALGSEELVP